MLANSPWDNIEQILIVISLRRLLARWWMAAHLPLCRVPERVFNMTIKCLSFGFYWGFLSLSCEPPSLLASAHFCLFPAFHPYGAASVHIKLRLFLLKLRCIFLLLSQDAPLIFYDTNSVNFMLPSDFLRPPLHIASLVRIDTNRFRPFALRFFPLLSRFRRYEKKMAGRTWKFA